MAESFLRLSDRDRSQILHTIAQELSRNPTVLEKDVWVCWVLKTLFSLSDELRMAFKGGTSLSKVFKVISRFSEDVDITLDYRGIDDSFDPFTDGVSRNQIKVYCESLKALNKMAAVLSLSTASSVFGYQSSLERVAKPGALLLNARRYGLLPNAHQKQ